MARTGMLTCAGALLIALCAGCDSDDIYVMFERFEIVGDERKPSGGGCMIAISDGPLGGGSVGAEGGSFDGDLMVSESGGGDSFVVVVKSQGEELERREYGKEELLSGERDTFTVTTLEGRVYEFSYWGGDECDTSHLPEDE
jgi:hypothetical protein